MTLHMQACLAGVPFFPSLRHPPCGKPDSSKRGTVSHTSMAPVHLLLWLAARWCRRLVKKGTPAGQALRLPGLSELTAQGMPSPIELVAHEL